MRIESSDFTDNGLMPRKCTGFGEDKSPELILSDLPDKTASTAVILDDLDVPLCKEFSHWIIWNISPHAKLIPGGLPGGDILTFPIRAVQGNAWGKHVYRGPKQPPFIHKAHRYRFTAYALDTMLDIPADSNKNTLIKAMASHIIEKAELIGIYDPANKT